MKKIMLILFSMLFLAISFNSAQGICSGDKLSLEMTSPLNEAQWSGIETITWDVADLICEPNDTFNLILYQDGHIYDPIGRFAIVVWDAEEYTFDLTDIYMDDTNIRPENGGDYHIIMQTTEQYSTIYLSEVFSIDNIELEENLLFVDIDLDRTVYRMEEFDIEIEIETGTQNMENIEIQVICESLDLNKTMIIDYIEENDDDDLDFEIDIPANIAEGEHELHVIVTGQDELGEFVTVEESVIFEVIVSDYHIYTHKIILYEDEYTAGDTIIGHVEIFNVGEYDATDILLRIYSLDLNYTEEYSLPNISAGEQYTFDLELPLSDILTTDAYIISADITFSNKAEQEISGLGYTLSRSQVVHINELIKETPVPVEDDIVEEDDQSPDPVTEKKRRRSRSHGGGNMQDSFVRINTILNNIDNVNNGFVFEDLSKVVETGIIFIDESVQRQSAQNLDAQIMAYAQDQQVCENSIRGFLECFFDWLRS